MIRYATLGGFSLAILLLACSIRVPERLTGSGNLVTVEQEYSGFDRLVIGDAFQATVRQGESFGVVIRIDDNLERYLQVEQDGQTLEIGLDSDQTPLIGSWTSEAEITMPALASLEIGGASHATLSGFASEGSLQLEASGASSITGDIQAGSTSMVASGASSITLTGMGGTLTLDVSGASSALLEGYACSDVRATVSGASNAVVNASGRLDADASGASHLGYVGSPTLGTINTSGGSSIEPE
jgi:hypothetical protein